MAATATLHGEHVLSLRHAAKAVNGDIAIRISLAEDAYVFNIRAIFSIAASISCCGISILVHSSQNDERMASVDDI